LGSIRLRILNGNLKRKRRSKNTRILNGNLRKRRRRSENTRILQRKRRRGTILSFKKRDRIIFASKIILGL
jgi:hypothetical protein